MQKVFWVIGGVLLAAIVLITSAPYLRGSKTSSQPISDCCSTNTLHTKVDAKAPADKRSTFTTTEWLPSSRRTKRLPPGLTVMNQDGETVPIESLMGKPMAISFFYTRCTNPNKCVRVVKRMTELQGALTEAGLAGKARLLLFTYDPEFDSASTLRKYGERQGVRFGQDMMMLRVEPREKGGLLEVLDVAVNFNADGVNLHGVQLLLVDAKGYVARSYHSMIWDNERVIEDIKALAVE